MKLNLGCGPDRKEGYVNVDKFQQYNPDQLADLNEFPYPWDDNSVDEVFMSHILEHLDDQQKVLEEIYRILKKGGKLKLIYPFWNNINRDSFGHTHVYNQFFINYFCTGNKTKTQYTDVSFEKRKEVFVPNGFFRFIPRAFLPKVASVLTSVVREIHWELEK